MEIAHKMDKRLYVAVNIFAHNRDLINFSFSFAAIIHGVIV